ncbi:MAG: hypothetical protein FJ255_02405 [Phycisphaerae bacterium]|nr:hypothetical protein [Phycisphaerae bacterium]
MRCKTCQYPLWEIRERICPECGSPFKPSDFDFVPNSVQFRCPHCNQSYYGTDARGHLVPSEFDCVSCGRHLRMDDAVLLPTEGVAEEVTRANTNPWLDGKGRWVTRWLTTVAMALFSPVRLMRGTPEGSRTSAAGRFCAVTSAAFLALGASLIAAMFLMPGLGRGGGMVRALAWAGLGLVVGVVGLTGIAALWGLAAHGVLRLTGPTHAGPARTVQCTLYASAGNVLMAVPWFGFYLWPFSILWWWGSAAAMVVEAQKVRVWRAIVGTAVIPALGLAAIGGTVGVALWTARQAVATVQATAAASFMQPIPPRDAFGLLIQHAEANAGVAPDHAARALLGYTPDPTRPAQWGGSFPTMLPELRTQSPAERIRRLDELAALVGAGTPNPAAAHRVDDLVFMYTGVDLLQPQDGGLWVIVKCPDPDLGDPPFGPRPVEVIRADGSGRNLRVEDLPAEVDRQNELRRALGVPEIPDPMRVQRVRPAPAPPG